MKLSFGLRFCAILAAFFILLFSAGCRIAPQEAGPTVRPTEQTASSTDTAKATDAADATEPARATPAPIDYDPADDFQNRFGACAGSSIWENDEIMLFAYDTYNYIGYYDKASDTFGVLCGKPDCMHDLSTAHNTDCNGYANGIYSHISVADGRLYFVAHDQYAKPAGNYLYSENLDGSDRHSEVCLPDIAVTGSVQQFYLHRGYLYMTADVQEVRNGAPVEYTRFSRLNVSSGDFELIFESAADPIFSGMFFVGNGIYMFNSSMAGVESCHNVIMRFDAGTGALKTVLDREEQGFDKVMYRLWADDTETLYYSVMQALDTVSVIYKVDMNGNPKPFMDFNDDEVLFDAAMFSDGIIIALGTARGGDPKDVQLWIRDFDGGTVYKGEFPRSFAKELGMEDFGFYDPQGNSDEVYVMFYNDEHHGMDSVDDICFVRFEIVSPTELSGHLVFRSAQ